MLSMLPREAIGITLLDAVVGLVRKLPTPVVLAPVEKRELELQRR